VNVSINIIVAIAGNCLIDLCYIFVIHMQQDATQRYKILNNSSSETPTSTILLKCDVTHVVTSAIRCANRTATITQM
jgi:hypothetical protein